MRKILLFAVVLVMFITIFPAFAADGTVSIVLDKDSAQIGERINATIKVENIEADSLTMPIHFNPDVVQIVDADGNIVLDGVKTAAQVRNGSIGLTPGQALSDASDENGDPIYWNGSCFTNGATFPEVDNKRGLYWLIFTNTELKLIENEDVITLHFAAVGEGDADIRFANKEDAVPERAAPQGVWYTDKDGPRRQQNVNVQPLFVTNGGGAVSPPSIQQPGTGESSKKETIIISPPSLESDILEYTVPLKVIENALARAADETDNAMYITVEAGRNVKTIIIQFPFSAVLKSLEKLVFSTEFNTPLGKIGFDHGAVIEAAKEEAQFIICTLSANERIVTIDGTPIQASTNEAPVKFFDDLTENHWAYDYIMTLVEGGYLNGMSETEFCPDENVTREQFAKMLVFVQDIYDGTANCDFPDLPASHWAYKDVSSAVNSGLITGYDDGTFGVGKNITRQEMAVMVSRASLNFPERVSEILFSDHDEIAAWASSAVTKMQRADIMKGMPDGSFAPNDNATRAQAARIIYSILFSL